MNSLPIGGVSGDISILLKTLKSMNASGVDPKISKLIDQILKILQGGISSGELGSLQVLMQMLGGDIPSSLMNKITKELGEMQSGGNIDTSQLEDLLMKIIEYVIQQLLDSAPTENIGSSQLEDRPPQPDAPSF